MTRNKDLSSETHQSIVVLRNEGYSMREIGKKRKISCNAVVFSRHRTEQTGSNQNRKSGRPRCTTEQEDKYIRVSSLRNRCLTSPQLAASIKSTRKTPISTSTVKRRLWDAGHLGRVAKKKPYLIKVMLWFISVCMIYIKQKGGKSTLSLFANKQLKCKSPRCRLQICRKHSIIWV